MGFQPADVYGSSNRPEDMEPHRRYPGRTDCGYSGYNYRKQSKPPFTYPTEPTSHDGLVHFVYHVCLSGNSVTHNIGRLFFRFLQVFLKYFYCYYFIEATILR